MSAAIGVRVVAPLQIEAGRLRVLTPVLGVLAISTAIVLAMLAYRSSLRVPLNYNEGWNAYWAHRAASGEPIYPPPGAMVFNNYPPLSFLLIGGLSKLDIDVWILGRIVAWLSFAGCAVLIHLVLRALGAARAAAGLGALVFCALMALNYGAYLGIYDPQLTAHCGMLTGLYVLVRGGGPSRRSVVLAAVIIVASGFIKHNLVALPLSITAWLALYRRDLLGPWIIAATASLVAGFLACLLAFGGDFFTGLATPRGWAGAAFALKLLYWLPPISLPALVAQTPLLRARRDRLGMLLAMFAAFALLIGCLGLAGYGVVYNALFELVIASSLVLGYRLGRSTLDTWICVAVVALVAWSSSLAAASLIVYRNNWIATQQQLRATAARSVAIIAAQPGPALCEDLLLCYWAGKSFSVDIFNYLQVARTGRRDEQALLSQIEQANYGVIEVDPAEKRMPPNIRAAVARTYRQVAGLPGVFIPRDPELWPSRVPVVTR